MEVYTLNDENRELVKELYTKAFPVNERIDFQYILNGRNRKLIFYDQEFIGFAFLLTYQDITDITYFAIVEEKRHQGYGSQCLSYIRHLLPDHRIIVDIESLEYKQDEQRIKRKQFYLKNGYHSTNLKYHWHDEDYEILVNGNDVSEQEYEDFWRYIIDG